MQRLLSFVLSGLFTAFIAAALSAQTLSPVAAEVVRYTDQGGAFQPVNLFAAAAAADPAALDVAPGAQFLRLDLEALAALVKIHPNAVALSLPYQGEMMTIDLVKAHILAPDFQVVTSESNGRPVAVETGAHYRGVVRGQENSLAAFSFFNGEVMGIISDDQHANRVLGRLDFRGNVSDYVLYSDAMLNNPFPFSCQVLEPGGQDLDDGDSGTGAAPAVNGCVRSYLETDYEMYQNKGSINNTTNYLTGLYNQVITLYTNEAVSTVISEIYIWTTPDSYSNTSSSAALNQFKNTRPTFNGDIGHLVSLGGQNIGGVAWLDVLCNNDYNYAYSNVYSSYQTFPTYSWSVMVMTHEIGHNMGSNHTQWCGWTGGALDNCYTTEGGCPPGPPPTNGGTIMSYCHLTSYGINFNNGFGPQPGNKIRAEVSGAGCLAPTCGGGGGGGGCSAPTGLAASNITATSATVSWGAVSGATNYNLQWKASTSSSWTTVMSITGTSYNLTGLVGNTTYNYKVQAYCNGTYSSFSATANFTTLPPPCTDTYESNNTQATAKVIPVNTNIIAKIGASNDKDWYRFSNTSVARNIKLELTNLPANYDVRLYRTTTLLGTSSNGGTADETIIYNTTTVSSSYYAYVYGATSSQYSNTECYTLRASISGTPWIVDDGDGEERRGDVVEIDIPVVFEDAGFNMTPNPADDAVQLEIPVFEPAITATVRLLDVAGKLLLEDQYELTEANNRVGLQLGDWSNGVYFVQVLNGDRLHTRKLVVQH